MSTTIHEPTTRTAEPETVLAGLLAEYDDPDKLVEACEKVRDAGYRNFDSLTPFPIHGIDDAMGVRPTVLPWFTLGAAMVGLATAVAMQYWMNIVDYPIMISGKPLSWENLPSMVPIMFELTVLFACITTFLCVFLLNGLPQFYHPVFGSQRFKRVTNDRFFLYIDAKDNRFHENETESLLGSTHPLQVERLDTFKVAPPLPPFFKYAAWILISVALLPPALIARARYSTGREPRIHIVQDMDAQTKFKAQRESVLFADGRADRVPPAGTLSQDGFRTDDHYYLGMVNGQFATTLPEKFEVTEEKIRRGRERFNIYCSACHGFSGKGNGTVAVRAAEIQQVWPVKSLHDDQVRAKPVGHVFNVITNGYQTMPMYGTQISVEDRWAIVLYVLALQRSQNATLEDVPEKYRGSLERIQVAPPANAPGNPPAGN